MSDNVLHIEHLTMRFGGVVADRLNRTFQRNVQKNSGFFNAPNGPWELHLYNTKGELEEVLDSGKGGEGMRQYPKIEKSGIMVVKDL